MRRPFRAVGFAFVVTCGAVVALVAWSGRAVPTDAFYSVPSPAGATPGTLLAHAPVESDVPAGVRAWRIRYATTTSRDTPKTATAIVALRADAPPGPRPVVAWAHGTTGVDTACAPSAGPEPLRGAGFAPAVAAGWVWVATDYAGLGTPGTHEYLVGAGEARAVLDAIRAARAVPGVHAEPRAVVWGHSQGGHAALWAGILAPAYAPDVVLSGVAAAAPATDLPELTAHVQHALVGRVLNAYLLHAYAATYDDVRFDDWSQGLRGRLARRMARGCLEGRTVVATLAAAAVAGGSIFAQDPRGGALGRRLADNSPTRPLAMPLLIAQGARDDLVLPSIQSRFVNARCAAGQSLEYATYPDRDHLTLVAPDSPLIADLVAWTRARFDGAPARDDCGGRVGPASAR